ncbi:MAG: YceI family protein [Pseudomonadota bacterium]
MHRFLTVFLALSLVCLAPAALGNWTIDNEQSRLSFVSIKAGTIAEVHHFGELQGVLANDGQFELVINLDSVETLIPIRNERMREMLFDTAKHPEAKLSAQLDLAPFRALAVGEQTEIAAEAQLELSGRTSMLTVQAVVARLADDKLLVTSMQPLTLNADMLGLGEGVEALREIAGLPSISPAVPVTFRLTLVEDH